MAVRKRLGLAGRLNPSEAVEKRVRDDDIDDEREAEDTDETRVEDLNESQEKPAKQSRNKRAPKNDEDDEFGELGNYAPGDDYDYDYESEDNFFAAPSNRLARTVDGPSQSELVDRPARPVTPANQPEEENNFFEPPSNPDPVSVDPPPSQPTENVNPGQGEYGTRHVPVVQESLTIPDDHEEWEGQDQGTGRSPIDSPFALGGEETKTFSRGDQTGRRFDTETFDEKDAKHITIPPGTFDEKDAKHHITIPPGTFDEKDAVRDLSDFGPPGALETPEKPAPYAREGTDIKEGEDAKPWYQNPIGAAGNLVRDIAEENLVNVGTLISIPHRAGWALYDTVTGKTYEGDAITRSFASAPSVAEMLKHTPTLYSVGAAMENTPSVADATKVLQHTPLGPQAQAVAKIPGIENVPLIPGKDISSLTIVPGQELSQVTADGGSFGVGLGRGGWHSSGRSTNWKSVGRWERRGQVRAALKVGRRVHRRHNTVEKRTETPYIAYIGGGIAGEYSGPQSVGRNRECGGCGGGPEVRRQSNHS